MGTLTVSASNGGAGAASPSASQQAATSPVGFTASGGSTAHATSASPAGTSTVTLKGNKINAGAASHSASTLVSVFAGTFVVVYLAMA